MLGKNGNPQNRSPTCQRSSQAKINVLYFSSLLQACQKLTPQIYRNIQVTLQYYFQQLFVTFLIKVWKISAETTCKKQAIIIHSAQLSFSFLASQCCGYPTCYKPHGSCGNANSNDTICNKT